MWYFNNGYKHRGTKSTLFFLVYKNFINLSLRIDSLGIANILLIIEIYFGTLKQYLRDLDSSLKKYSLL